MASWLPLFVREKNQAAREKYEALVEIPSLGLQRAMADYVAYCLVRHDQSYRLILDRERTMALEQALDIDLHGKETEHPLTAYLKMEPLIRLSVVDYCVQHFTDGFESLTKAEALCDAMQRARFAYTLDAPGRCVRRVLATGVGEVVRDAFGIDAAQAQMREAVHWSTGLNPDATKAFDAMIRALEAVVKPALAPKDKAFTLGRVLGQLRASQIALASKLPRSGQASPQSLPTGDVVRGMLELVWSGYERHAGGSEPTVEEARSLLGVAGSLVVWFGTGVVKKA